MSNQAPPPHQNQHAPSPRHRQRGGGLIFDVLAVLFISASVGVMILTLLIIQNPKTNLNPFPATDLPTAFQSFTPSATFTPSLTATATETPVPPSATPTDTPSPIPTLTSSPTLSPTPVLPGFENLPTIEPGQRDVVDSGSSNPVRDPNAPFPFVVQAVRYEANSRPSGCNFVSLAGNVTGLSGEPITDLVVVVTGDDFEFTLYSGNDPDFGLSGFEVELGNRPFADTYEIRLFGTDGQALSDLIEVEIGDTCQTNVTIVEFLQVRDF